MLKHSCEDPTICKKCLRNARLKTRYHTDATYKSTLQTRARTYRQTTPLDETAANKNRATARARYHRLKDDPVFKASEKQRNQKRNEKRRPKLYRFPALPSKSGKPTTQAYWKMVVGLLAERDGWHCALCHTLVTWETASIEHVIPRCLEPDNHSPSNLRLAHRRCNSLRGISHRNQ